MIAERYQSQVPDPLNRQFSNRLSTAAAVEAYKSGRHHDVDLFPPGIYFMFYVQESQIMFP